jgi:hypothetical protein
MENGPPCLPVLALSDAPALMAIQFRNRKSGMWLIFQAILKRWSNAAQ